VIAAVAVLIHDSVPPEPFPAPSIGQARAVTEADTAELGRLYFDAYPPGAACATEADATADVTASFAGEYGPLLRPATLAIESDGKLIAAVMTVSRAPWPDVPGCPFVIELFTAARHRRRGLASALLWRVLDQTDGRLALRVADDNAAALQLYARLGFTSYAG
jgi:GNAT superfamily N-acetyltransferase